VLPSRSRDACTWRIALIAIGGLLALAACESSRGPRPALELDVAQYLARVKQWAPAEREASLAINEIFRSHFVDVDAVMSVTHRMLPSVDEHVAAIGGYAPRTPEIVKIHERYTRAWRRLREGLQQIDDGMKKDDAMLLAEGRRRLEAWSEDMVRVAAELRELADAVGISKTSSADVRPSSDRAAS
jgi:hypothetical protein